MLEKSKLSEHKIKNGKFITPFNQFFEEILQENSWYHGRMPEYIWLGLIIDYGERNVQLNKCIRIMQYLQEITNGDEIDYSKLSLVFNLSEDNQIAFYHFLEQLDVLEPLKSLSVVFPTESKIFLEFINGYELSVKKRVEMLNDILKKLSDHQSDLSTDVRFVIVYKFILSGELVFLEGINTEFITEYPKISHNDPKMRLLRPQIRSMEIGLNASNNPDESIDMAFVRKFWERISLITDCEVFSVELNNKEKEPVDLEEFKEKVYKILEYYSKVFQETRPLDNKMLVLLGIFTYSYKRLLELVDHNLEHTISGRALTRSIIENYMMTKYLLHEEKKHEDIWKEYQYYGIGQYKMIYKRFEEKKPNIKTSHVPYEYISVLVSEFKDEEFINMDTSYFGKGSIRNKFDQVDEGDLWRYYYDYDSAFEHGLWGAIRESSILKCNAPGHQYHGIPDIDNIQKLRSVADDCIMVLIKHIKILDKEYSLPDILREGFQDE